MKLTIFLFFLAISQMMAVETYSQSTLLSLNLKSVAVKDVLDKIEKNSEFVFLYNCKLIDVGRTVSMEFKDQNISKILDKLFQNTDVVYIVIDRQIVLTNKANQSGFLELSNAQQQNSVSGKVTDSSGASLPGVSVVLKGTTTGTITDSNGNYSISKVPENAILQFSFVGMKTQEIAVGGKLTINVTLTEETVGLKEVVAVGYGTQKKTSITASVSTLKGDKIASIPISDLSNGIGGQISGVIVKQSYGEPGNDGSDIYIRGISTTGTTEPLIIVDGIPRGFTQLDPNSIESFTVLKDAAAVAPYGVAGANGVILVTTKRGKTGAPSLTYNGYTGFQNPTILPDYANAYQYATLKNAAAKNEGVPLPYSDYTLQKFKDGSDPDAFWDPNYRELIRKNAVLTNHNIELSGGTEKVKYYASFGYQSQEGMWSRNIPLTKDQNGNKKYNLAINLDAQVTTSTKIYFNVNGRVQNTNNVSTGQARIWDEFQWAHTEYGPNFFSNGMNGNYITAALVNDGYSKLNTMALYSQLSVEQELPFIPGLRAKGTIAYDPTTIMSKTWLTPLHIASVDTTQRPYVFTDGIYQQTKSSLDQSFNQSHQLTYQASLDYAKSFGKNNISALALWEAKANNYQSLWASRINYNLGIDEISMGSSSQEDMTNGGTSGDSKQVGLVYRATYSYADKYLFEASGRYDGSYYFAQKSRFGFFPAFSVGWRLSEEKFIKKVDLIDNLKIRASYGEVGALAGSPFQYLSTYYVYGPAYVIGGQGVQGVAERSEPNPNITWERAKKSDIGLEASFWKGLLSIEADYFYEKRSNMLLQPEVLVPVEYGIGLSQENAGIMKNQGIDLSIASRYSVSKDFQVSLSGNLTYAKNSFLQVFETPVTYNNPNRRITGRPLGTQFGFHALGFFQLSDFTADGTLKEGIAIQPWGEVKPGDLRYEDIKPDGQINDDDQTVIGGPRTPQLIYGISPGIRYKSFSLDMLFQGVAKSDVYMIGTSARAFEAGRTAYVDNFNYWTPDNPNAKYPRITTNTTSNNSQTSSWWVRKGDYLRMKSIMLAYTIPSLTIKKIGIENAKIYVSGQNILTLTKMINWDPEVMGVSNGASRYPLQRVISIGTNITF